MSERDIMPTKECTINEITNNGNFIEDVENESPSDNNMSKSIEISSLSQDTSVVEINGEKPVCQDQTEVSKITYLFENCKEVAKFNELSYAKKHFNGCKWSPDGTCFLTSCADYTLRIFDLPKDIHSKSFWCTSENDLLELTPSLNMLEGGIIYDYAWYPYMSSWDPLTCCFISTSAGSPVHLWDAYTGKIRASYRAYDYADEVHAALSLAFSTTGAYIYCGFPDYVKIFDLSKPGRDCDVFNLKVISGQRGLVSCISENPSMPDVFAVGTYSKNIGLYTNSKEFICLLTGQKSGLTHLKFSSDGLKLFSGARMDNEIICWDIRNPGTVLSVFDRSVQTNQRIYFDLSSDAKYLISGGTDGICQIWDVQEETKSNSEGKMKSIYQFRASNDCVNGVSLHGSYPVIATASGQYHYPDLSKDEDEHSFIQCFNGVENSVKLWWIGPIKEDAMIIDS